MKSGQALAKGSQTRKKARRQAQQDGSSKASPTRRADECDVKAGLPNKKGEIKPD